MSDYKAFKFGGNSQEMRVLKRDTEKILEVRRQSSDGIVEKAPQVNEFLAWKDWDPLQAVPCATSLSIKEGSKERKKNYTKKIVEEPDTPELVAFFQEHSYQFVKTIFMDREVPPLDKCLVASCEMNHKMLDSELDNKNESTKGTQEIMLSLSNESKLGIEKDSNKDVINKYESKNLKMKDEENTDARDVGLLDCLAEKIGTDRQLIEEGARAKADLENSMVQSVIEVIIDNSFHTTNASSEGEMESRSITHNSDSPTTAINSKEEFQQHAYSQHFIEACHKPQGGMSETSSNQEESNSLPFDSHTGPTVCSEHTLYSGSISCQSNSSNASSNSFVFPILPSEWNGSPVRMVKADRRQLRKQRSWNMCFLCSKF